jgi:hypothetical protein
MDNTYIDKDEIAANEKKAEKKQRVTKERKTRVKSSIIVQILNGEILAKDLVLNNLSYFFFVVFLLIMLVAKNYYGKQLTKDIDSSLKKLDASTAEYVESKGRLEEKTKRYELVRKLEPKGLKETTKPAKVIRIKSEE